MVVKTETHGTALTAPHQYVPMVLRQTSATNCHAAQEGQVVLTKTLRRKGVVGEEDVVAVKVSIAIVLMVLLQDVQTAPKPT